MPDAAAHCKYCAKAALPADLRPLATLDASDVMLFEDARHPGRCVVAAHWHVRDVFELDDSQRDRFLADVARVARAVRDAMNADKVNIALYGDLSDHLHAHVVPKHRGGPKWGDAFVLQPQAPLPPAQREELLTKLGKALRG